MSIYIHREGKLIPLAGREYSSLPIATILPFAGNTVPDEFLLCDGSEFDVTKYPDLYSALGRNTTPDLRGRFLEGRTASQTMLTNIAAGLPNITGGFKVSGSNGGLDYMSGAFYPYTGSSGAGAGSTGTSGKPARFDASRSSSIYGASETVQPPATVVDYIIKATPSMSADVSRFLTSGYVDMGPQELLYTSPSFTWNRPGTANAMSKSWEYDSEYAGTIAASIWTGNLGSNIYWAWSIRINDVVADIQGAVTAMQSCIKAPIRIGDHVEIWTAQGGSNTLGTSTARIFGVER